MATVFINEFHYKGTGTSEFVEIAGPAGTNLSNYTVVVYKNDGTILKEEPLSGTIQNQADGFGTVSVDFDDIPEDGAIALVNNNAVDQFLSYGGTVTATADPTGVTGFSGTTSTNIGVVETTETGSLQLQGTDGDEDSDFRWKRVDASSSKGAINASQSFDGTGDESAPTLDDTLAGGSITPATINRDTDLVVEFADTNAAPAPTRTAGIKAGTGNILIKKTSDDSVVETIDVTDKDKVTISGTNVTIDPENNLVDGTEYYIEFQDGAILDLAGNPYEAASTDKDATTFTVNDLAPAVVSASFDDDSETSEDESTIVPVDSTLTFTFDEEVTRGVGDITLTQTATDVSGANTSVTNVIGISNISVSGKTVTITPSVKLDGDATYEVAFDANSVLDKTGNSLTVPAAADRTFTTALSDAPEITNLSPTDNFDDFLVGDNIEITFNEDVQAGSGDIVIKKDVTGDGASNDDTEVASQVTFDGNKVIINPNSNLEANTDYYVEIANGAIEDTDGNDFDGTIPAALDNNGDSTFNFNTVDDITAPELAEDDTFSPEDDATNVPTDNNLTITFNEAVKAGEGTIVIKDASDDNVVGEIEYDEDGNPTFDGVISGADLPNAADMTGVTTVTISLGTDLDTSTQYYVEIEAGAITDLVGNEFAGITDKTTFNFETASDDGPVSLKFTPSDDSTNVPVDSDIVIEFNEDIVGTGSGTISITSVDGSDPIRVFDINAGAVTTTTTGVGDVTISGTKVTINPTDDLAFGKDYFVEVQSTALTDTDTTPDPFAGFSGSTTFNFSTAASGAPVLVSRSTDDDDTTADVNENETVAVDANLVLTFNENVREGDGNITIFQEDGTEVEVIDVDTPAVQSSGKTITINPAADLEAGMSYYVQIEDGAIEDVGGEAFGGISDTTSFAFTTAAAPDITPPAVVADSASPADGDTDVAVDANITFNLGENVTAVAGKNITITDEDGTVTTIAADDATQISMESGVVTINPAADLMEGKEYTVAIESGAFVDAAGNEFDGTLATDGTFNFTTVDNDNDGGGGNGGGTPITPIDTSNTDADGNVMEVIDLTAFAGQTVTASFEITRDADFDNNIYFYKVDAADGNIGGVAPDADGYLDAALGAVVNPDAGLDAADGGVAESGTLSLDGGDILGIAIVADGTLAQATSDLDSVEGVYLSYMGANTDDGSFDHIRVSGNTFEFEDLANGGDADFDDIRIDMTFSV